MKSYDNRTLLQLLKDLSRTILMFKSGKSPSDVLYDVAYKNLGRDLAPGNEALGCALTVSKLINQAYGDSILFSGTYTLWEWLDKNSKFIRVPKPFRGDIIISPTGLQPSQSRIKHGHVGVVGNTCIISNNSYKGILDTALTVDSWLRFYGETGGFPVYYYRRIML